VACQFVTDDRPVRAAFSDPRDFSIDANGDLVLGDVICWEEEVRAPKQSSTVAVAALAPPAGSVLGRRVVAARIIGDSDGASGYVARGDAGKPALSRWDAPPGALQPPRDARSSAVWTAVAARNTAGPPPSDLTQTLGLTRSAPVGADPGRELVLEVLHCSLRGQTARKDILLEPAANVRRSEARLARCDIFRRPWHHEEGRLTWVEERLVWEIAAQPAISLTLADR
jgi:hypothetical protein